MKYLKRPIMMMSLGKLKSLSSFPVSKEVKCQLLMNLDRTSTPRTDEMLKNSKLILEERRRTIEEVRIELT